MEGDNIFVLSPQDEKRYKKVLEEFYKFYHSKPANEAEVLAVQGLNNLVNGLDLTGKKYILKKNLYFDEILSKSVREYWLPDENEKYRYPIQNDPLKRRKRGKKISTIKVEIRDEKDEKEKVKNIVSNLLKAYPNLDRADLRSSINTYARLSVGIDRELDNPNASSRIVKEKIESQVKLGAFLGIDEGLKAKQKADEDRQSIAALAVQFTETIDAMPELLDSFKYTELMIFLEKYNRQELSKELFMLPSYAGMSIDDARIFVEKRHDKYK